MRKHSVRKCIHAICDLLPLFVIPIFAIYTHRHNVAQDTVIVEDKPIYYESNEINSVSDIVVDKVYFWEDNLTFTTDLVNKSFGQVKPLTEYININPSFNLQDTIIMYGGDWSLVLSQNGNNIVLLNRSLNIIFLSLNYNNLGLIYEHFTYSQSLIVKEYQEVTTTYPNDVGSGLMNTLYTTCHNYFDFNNVGNFGDIYNWFEINLFNGTAPQSFYIVWTVILFEFIMDLIFLTYMVFMFIIDFTECMIDRFFEKSYRGGR